MITNNYIVSVIICTYNRKRWLEDLLKSISEQTIIPKEVIIVDAYEKDINYSYPEGLNIKLIKSDEMQLTYQKNLGLDKAEGDIIFFLDDDLLLEKTYIKKTLDVFLDDSDKKIGAVSGYITNQWGIIPKYSELFLKFAKFLNIYDGDSLPGSVSPSGIFIELSELKPFSGTKKTDFVPGGCTAFRKEVFERFRPPLIINKYGGEDKTFSRMIANDWEMCVCGDARLQHFSASGGARQSNFSETWCTAKYVLYIQKNYGVNNRNTLRLRAYWLLASVRMYLISIIMLLSIIKIKKSIRWFNRASGYAFGAFSVVDSKNE